MTTYLLKELNV